MAVMITKRDGRKVPFDRSKIVNAIFKAAQSVGGTDLEAANRVADLVITALALQKNEHTVEEIQDRIEKELIEEGHAKTAKSFILYRQKRSDLRQLNSSLNRTIRDLIFEDAENIEDKRENANINANATMGSMLKIGGTVTKEFNLRNCMAPEHAQMHRDGKIHYHDADFATLTFNCLQIPLNKLLDRGFNTGHGCLRTPATIGAASTLTCIAIQSSQNDCFGGQSIPSFDFYLAPYVAKSYVRNCAEYLKCFYISGDLETDKRISDFIKQEFIKPLDQFISDEGRILTDEGKKYLIKCLHNVLKQPDIVLMTENQASQAWIHDGRELPRLFSYAESKTDRDTFQAMEAFVHNMCTLASRAGSQVPFSSVNTGLDTSPEGRMVTKNLFLATEAGLGNGETAIFPISIMKLKKGITDKGSPNYDLFQLSCRVSAKRLYPNWVNLDAPFNLQYYKADDPDTHSATMGLLMEGQIKLQYLPKGKDKYVIEKMDISDVGHWVHEHFPNVELNKFDDWTHWMNLEDCKIFVWDGFGDAWTQVKKWLRSYDPRRKWIKITFKHTYLGAHRGPQFTITCTTDHPLPVLRDHEWTRVKGRDLVVGDTVYGNKEKHQVIEKIEELNENECGKSFEMSLVGYDFQTVSDRFSVDKIVSHNCRTRVVGNVHDKNRQIYPGRGNLFPITINLPYIALEAKEALGENATKEELINEFFKRLQKRQEDVFDILEERFEIIAKRKAKNYPFVMGQHLYQDSDTLNPESEIREVLKHGTLTSGFIGLAETLIVLTGKHHGESEESQQLGLKIVGFLNDMNVKKSEETKMNFTLMGSPAEGCCGRLLRATRKRFGVIKGVTNHEYFVNSHHR